MAWIVLYCALAGMFVGFQLRHHTNVRPVVLFDLGSAFIAVLAVSFWSSTEEILLLVYTWYGYYSGIDT